MFACRSAWAQGSAASARRPPAAGDCAHGTSNGPSWPKRPQRLPVLKLSALFDETWDMPLPIAPSQSQLPTDRQLVFTSSQAARYLGVSLATIRRWTDAGHISCYRTPGGQRRFSRDQLDAFVASMYRGDPAGRTATG